jgi:urease subunit gamma/beta
VCEAARDGKRVAEAAAAGAAVLGPDDVLPGVADVVTDVKVEAVFDDGTRMVVVRQPFGPVTPSEQPVGGIVPATPPAAAPSDDVVRLTVVNVGEVPISITSHFHFFEVNKRLQFDRAAAYGMRLAIPAGTATRFEPGDRVAVALVPIGGERVAIGFAGLVDGPLDAPGARAAALTRAAERGYL